MSYVGPVYPPPPVSSSSEGWIFLIVFIFIIVIVIILIFVFGFGTGTTPGVAGTNRFVSGNNFVVNPNVGINPPPLNPSNSIPFVPVTSAGFTTGQIIGIVVAIIFVIIIIVALVYYAYEPSATIINTPQSTIYSTGDLAQTIPVY